MPTYDGIGSSVTHEIEVVGDVFISNVEGGSLSTQVPFEIFSNVSGMATPPTDSRQVRLRVQPSAVASPDDSYVTDMGIQNTTDNYFFITAPQNTSTVGVQNTFVISKTSNVGIGTTNPQQPLHVVGNAWITGTLTASNIVGASPVTISSDIVMGPGTTLTAAAIEPPSGVESNMNITGTITTSNIVAHTNENLLISSSLEVGTSNLFVNTENGNVGIGTDSPDQKLHIKGGNLKIENSGDDSIDNKIIFAETGYNDAFFIGTDLAGTGANDQSFKIGYSASGDSGIVNSNVLMTVLGGGNVGIGNASPETKLHVNGAIKLEGQTVSEGSTDEGNRTNTYIEFAPAGTINDWAYLRQIGGNNLFHMALDFHDDGNDARFSIRDVQSTATPDQITTRFTVASGGNVGIGTDNPLSTLHVGNGIILTEGDASGSISLYGTGSRKSQANIPGIYHRAYVGLGLWSDAEMSFQVSGDAASPLDAMRIVRSGNVGIGQASPTAPLHITSSDPRMLIGASDFGGGEIEFGNTNHGVGRNTGIVNFADANDVALHTAGTGSAGIASNYGNYYIKMLNNGNAVSSDGSPFGLSDVRIKKDIIDIDDTYALQKIREIKPRLYKYKSHQKHNETVFGFIAQEIHETLPYSTIIGTETIPNIQDYATVTDSNVITFTNFNTNDLDSNSSIIKIFTNLENVEYSNLIKQVTITEIINENTIKIDTDIIDDRIFVYGQEVNDFHFLKKECIFTVAVAALQEVDRQLQAEKQKTANLETQMASLLARIEAFENSS